VGFIAQEVQAVNEHFGVTNNIVVIDDDGFHRMDYEKLMAPVVRAVQELDAAVRERDAAVQKLDTTVREHEVAMRARDAVIATQQGRSTPYCRGWSPSSGASTRTDSDLQAEAHRLARAWDAAHPREP
jgi:hypothetical protein